DRRARRVGHQLAAPIDAERLSELRVGAELEAVIIRLAFAVGEDGQAVADRAGRRLEDEVRESAVVEAALDVDRAGGAVDAELDRIARLLAQVRVADLERLAAAGRAVGEQCAERG